MITRKIIALSTIKEYPIRGLDALPNSLKKLFGGPCSTYTLQFYGFDITLKRYNTKEKTIKLYINDEMFVEIQPDVRKNRCRVASFKFWKELKGYMALKGLVAILDQLNIASTQLEDATRKFLTPKISYHLFLIHCLTHGKSWYGLEGFNFTNPDAGKTITTLREKTLNDIQDCIKDKKLLIQLQQDMACLGVTMDMTVGDYCSKIHQCSQNRHLYYYNIATVLEYARDTDRQMGILFNDLYASHTLERKHPRFRELKHSCVVS